MGVIVAVDVARPMQLVEEGAIAIVQYKLGGNARYVVYTAGKRLPLFMDSGGSAVKLADGESTVAIDNQGSYLIKNEGGVAKIKTE